MLAGSALRLGMLPVYAAADEDLRAPFMLVRTALNAPLLRDAAQLTSAREAYDRALIALSGEPSEALQAGLSAWEDRLRTFDVTALAIRAVAASGPLALLLDDLQWADEPSLKLLRYLARVVPDCPVFLAVTIRPEDAPTA